MKTKTIKGSMTITYSENGAVPAITFLPEVAGEVGIVITASPTKNVLAGDTSMALIENPVVSIMNKKSL